MSLRTLPILAALLLTSWSLAFSQSSTWELGLGGGALRHDLFTETDNDLTIGGGLTRHTAGGWGLGATVDYADVGEQTLGGGTAIDARLLRYAAEVSRSFPAQGRARLSLGAGIGAATMSYSGLPGSGDKRETNLMVPVGGSIRLLNRAVRPTWGLTVGAKDQMVFLGDTDAVGDPRDSGIAHHVQGTVGVSLFFGGGGKAAHARATAPTPTTPAVVADDSAERDARARALAEIREKIYFDFDRFDLKPAARETLQRKAEALRALPGVTIVIEGHADERGTVEYNLALGEKRARAALDYLRDLGIDPARVSVVSYGEERPALDGHDESAWRQNRRDEFVPSER